MRTIVFLCALLCSAVCKSQGLESSVRSNFLDSMAGDEKAALLMVHFGTTHDDTRSLTIDAINKKVAAEFPGIETRDAYTSRIIIKRLKSRGIVKNTPVEALMKLRSEGFTRVIVQSTNIIAGTERESLLKDVELMAPFFKEIRVGTPLLYDIDDAEKVASILTERNPANAKRHEHVVFVGHGTEGPATAVYAMFDYMLKANGHDNYHVATIEGYPTIDNVIKTLKRLKARSVKLVPFMFVAGDHAKNDIATEWREEMEKNGIKAEVNIEGLGQIAEIQDIFVQHLRHCMNYHERSIMEKKMVYALPPTTLTTNSLKH